MANKFGKDFAIVGGIALVKGRIRNSNKIWNNVECLIDKVFKNENFIENKKFSSITLVYRYGVCNNLQIDYQRINRSFNDLPVGLELNMEILEWADQHNLDLLHDIFMIAALEAMIQIGKKYKFETNVFETERAKYGDIPNTIEECKAYHARRA